MYCSCAQKEVEQTAREWGGKGGLGGATEVAQQQYSTIFKGTGAGQREESKHSSKCDMSINIS